MQVCLALFRIRFLGSHFIFVFSQALPEVARLFMKAVSYPACLYPNDYTFLFYQRFGYARKLYVGFVPGLVAFDLDVIDKQINSLKHTAASSAYAKQKNFLKDELQKFLFSLPDKKHLFSATPFKGSLEVIRFIVYKDGKGKTKVHSLPCLHIGHSTSVHCECPSRLSYNTVDYYIGKLRDAGHQGDWKVSLGIGNPASALEVKEYLKVMTAEQLQARVIPKEATPLFIDILTALAHVLERCMLSTLLSPTELFIVPRDQAFFKTIF